MKTCYIEFPPEPRRVPPLRDEVMTIDSPLNADEVVKPPIWVRLIPIGIVVLVIVMLVMMISMGRRMMSPMMFMMPLMLVMGMMGMSMHGGGSGTSMQEVDIDRKNWLLKLRELRKMVQDQGHRIHTLAVTVFPHPDTMTSLTSYRNMWQVKQSRAYQEALAQSPFTEHPFLSARAGVGMVPLLPRINYEEQQVPENLEPVTAGQFGRFLRTQQVVTNCPISIRLDEERSYGMRGKDIEARLDLSRAMICSLAYNHSPNEVLIGIITDPTNNTTRDRWEWLKWLPHNQNVLTSSPDMPPTRLAWSSMEDFAQHMASDIAARNSQGSDYVGQRMVVFVDTPDAGVRWPATMLGGVNGVTFVVVAFSESKGGDGLNSYQEGRSNMLRVDPDGSLSVPGRANMLTIDRMPLRRAENIARQFSRWRPTGFGNLVSVSSVGGGVEIEEDLPTWFDVLNIHDIESYDPRVVWAANAHTETFRTPIGYKWDGKRRTSECVYLDMIEASRGGTGPHGCLQGKTGTGKSYLLNGVVLSMCALYGPDKVSFILADFKAGAAFDGYQNLPHVITVLTNLETQKEMVERAGAVIDGEIIRREEFLFQYKVKDILEYRKMQKKDPSLPPLPDMFLIADEFHEFMIGNRAYLKLFTRIGAKGRSLGMHVIPCSQFIDASLLSDLMNHLTFGISLAASSASYSRTVLDGDPSAANLPVGKGHAMIRYLDKETQENKVETFVGFSIEDPYVSKTRTEEQKVVARQELEDSALPFGLFATDAELVKKQKKAVEDESVKVHVHDTPQKWALIEHLNKFQEVQAPNLWQKSLAEPMSLGDTTAEEHMALRQVDGFALRLGDLDDPLHHSRPPFVIYPDGNIVVTGSSKAGKSMTVMTMVANSAFVYESDVNWYLVDYVGGGLAPVEGFPNVGGYCTKMDTDIIERFLGEFYNVLDYREQVMAERRISRVEDYLRQKKENPDPRDPYGRMVLVFDGFDAMVLEDEEWKTSVLRLLTNGGRHGLHVVSTVPDISALPIKQQTQYGTVVTLRVDDTARMGTIPMPVKQAMKLIPDQAGRGIDLRTGMPSLIMVPKTEPIPPAQPEERGRQAIFDYNEDHSASIIDLGARLSENMPHSPRIAVVGDKVSYADVWQTFSSVPGVTDKANTAKKDRWLPLGIDTKALTPVLIPKASPHMLISGDPGVGKTTTLRTIITSVVNQYDNNEAKFVIMDPSFSLMNEMEGLVKQGYMKQDNYVSSREESRDAVESLKKILHKRTPRKDMNLTPRMMLERSWFDGPEIFVIIDGWQRIGTVPGSPSPVDELIPFLSAASDLGVHLIVSASAQGFSSLLTMNKMFKVFTEQTAPILLLSGPSTESRMTSLKAKFETRRVGRGQLLLPAESRSVITQVAFTEQWAGSGD